MTTAEVKATLSPEDLEDYKGLLVVCNTTQKRIVHSPLSGPALYLSPKGVEGDITQLPREVAENVNFQRVWRSGGVEVLGGEEAKRALSSSEDSITTRRKERSEEVQSLMTASPNANDLIPNFTPGKAPTFSTPDAPEGKSETEVTQGQVIEQYIGDDGEIHDRVSTPTLLDRVIGDQ